MIAALLLAAGIILHANDDAFAGAEAVAWVLTIYGGIGVAIQALMLLLVTLGVTVVAADEVSKSRRKRRTRKF